MGREGEARGTGRDGPWLRELICKVPTVETDALSNPILSGMDGIPWDSDPSLSPLPPPHTQTSRSNLSSSFPRPMDPSFPIPVRVAIALSASLLGRTVHTICSLVLLLPLPPSLQLLLHSCLLTYVPTHVSDEPTVLEKGGKTSLRPDPVWRNLAPSAVAARGPRRKSSTTKHCQAIAQAAAVRTEPLWTRLGAKARRARKDQREQVRRQSPPWGGDDPMGDALAGPGGRALSLLFALPRPPALSWLDGKGGSLNASCFGLLAILWQVNRLDRQMTGLGRFALARAAAPTSTSSLGLPK